MSRAENIADALAESARRWPERPAIIAGRDAISFSELDRRVRAADAFLRAQGLRVGDRVVMAVPMGVTLYEVLLGVARAGLVAVIPTPGMDRAALSAGIDAVGARAIVGPARIHVLGLAVPALRRIPLRLSTTWPLPWARAWRPDRPGTGPSRTPDDDGALITFTSGSTGMPKGVLRTHAFLRAQHEALVGSIELEEGEVDLTTLPVFLLANLGSGLTSVVPAGDLRHPAALAPPVLCAQIREAGVTRTTASPALLERLADHCLATGTRLGTLRKVFTGGAPVFPRLLEKLARVAPGARVFAVYGSTEAEPVARVGWHEMSPEDLADIRGGKGLLAGRVEPRVRLAVLRQRWGEPLGPWTQAELEQAHAPAGESGEIVVTGDHVLKGYLGGRGDSETKLRVDGEVWHRTGDAGRLDGQGRVWLLGRCEARIDRGSRGGFVHPFAVEAAVSDVPGLRRSALVERGGRVLLAVECASEASVRAVVERVRDGLAWSGIDEIRTLGTLPVDARHNAKVDYPALRRAVEAEGTTAWRRERADDGPDG